MRRKRGKGIQAQRDAAAQGKRPTLVTASIPDFPPSATRPLSRGERRKMRLSIHTTKVPRQHAVRLKSPDTNELRRELNARVLRAREFRRLQEAARMELAEKAAQEHQEKEAA